MTVSVTWITARVCVVTWWYASKHMKRAGDVRMCLARSVQSPVHFESKTDTCDCDGLKFTAGLISHWDSGCTCRTGRFLDLCKKWCVSSLVCEYLFIQLLPHLTSPPFVAELVSPVCSLAASLLSLLLHFNASPKWLAARSIYSSLLISLQTDLAHLVSETAEQCYSSVSQYYYVAA